MHNDRIAVAILRAGGISAVIAATLLLGACASMSPAHFGKFTFTGTVTDESGKPVPNAWVKVRGWETLTDSAGKWQEIQIVNCGTLREHVESYEENDSVLVTADGYRSSEQRYVIKHPGYFQSCTAEQTLVLDAVLQKAGAEPAAKSPANPSSEEPGQPEQPTKRKGTYTL